MLHLCHILKQKLDIITDLRLSVGIWPKYQKKIFCFNYQGVKLHCKVHPQKKKLLQCKITL